MDLLINILPWLADIVHRQRLLVYSKEIVDNFNGERKLSFTKRMRQLDESSKHRKRNCIEF